MTEPNSTRKKRSDKFPLTLYPTGQYCKKIKGKLYYFGPKGWQIVDHKVNRKTYAGGIVGGQASLKSLLDLPRSWDVIVAGLWDIACSIDPALVTELIEAKNGP